MKAERLIHPLFTLLLTLSCGDLHEDLPAVVAEVNQPVPSFTYEIVSEDIYDAPVKTQVTQNIELVGEISRGEMEGLLNTLFQNVSASTGYEYRDHPDAIYIFVYSPGAREENWIAKLMKHAASSTPLTTIRIETDNYAVISENGDVTFVNPNEPVVDDIPDQVEEVADSDDAEATVARFESANGIILDTETGLQWQVGPDIDVNYIEACSWVNGLGSNWHMPNLDELSELYECGIRWSRNWGAFENSGWWVWADDSKSLPSYCPHPSAEWRFFFDCGDEDCDLPQSELGGGRVFAVSAP